MAAARKLGLTREVLTDLTAGELRSVAGAATSTCTSYCDETVVDCDRFTYACTALSIRLCVTGIG